jgi:hypothetical protein
MLFGFDCLCNCSISRIHPEESDFCPDWGRHIQLSQQAFKNPKLRILAALLIVPTSAKRAIVLNKIIEHFVLKVKIEEIVKMDEQKNSYPGVYQRAKDRLEYEEAMTLRDTEARERDAEERAAREKAELQKPDGEYTSINKAAGLAREETESLTMNGEDDPSSRVTRLATLSVTFAPEPNFMRPPRWNQYMLERRAWEADGLDALHSHLRDVSLSNGSHSTGHIRSVIRKSRSKIFGIRPVQENEDVPTMTKQSFVSRAAISLFSNSVDKREHPSVTSGRSFSAPIDQGPTGPRRVRDLQMEEAAKAMGFVLDTNRFGFQEIFIGGGTVPTQIQEAMSTADDPSISDVEDDYTDDEGTVFGECDTEVLSENQEAFHTPPCSTKVPAPATQHGLGDVEDR